MLHHPRCSALGGAATSMHDAGCHTLCAHGSAETTICNGAWGRSSIVPGWHRELFFAIFCRPCPAWLGWLRTTESQNFKRKRRQRQKQLASERPHLRALPGRSKMLAGQSTTAQMSAPPRRFLSSAVECWIAVSVDHVIRHGLDQYCTNRGSKPPISTYL